MVSTCQKSHKFGLMVRTMHCWPGKPVRKEVGSIYEAKPR